MNWKKDKEGKGIKPDSVKIISKESGKKIGELTFNLNTRKKRD